MKSITYKLLAVLFCGIMAMGFINKPQSNTILILSTDSKVSALTLSQSAEIITKRLQAFSKETFEIKTIPDKNQIKVVLYGKQDLKIMESLIVHKGKLEFYEAYNNHDLNLLLKGDSTLVKLLNPEVHYDSSPELGCTSAGKVNAVDKYLNSLKLGDKCKFAWSNFFGKPEVCLFALRLEKENIIPLTGQDIQSFELKHDSDRQKDNILFKFKTPAIQVWADVTKRNLDRAIAIVMDNNVLYAPVVRDEINGGNCEISGGFTHAQVQYIAAIGANGELPVDFIVVK
jgi:preprotein translocase subunit SecD